MNKGNKERNCVNIQYDKDYCKKTLLEMVKSSPAFNLDSPAIRYFKTVIYNREFMENINKTSIAFKNLGIKENDLVFIFMLNTPEFGYTYYGLNAIGAVSEWFNPNGITPDLIRKMINENNIKYMIISDVLYSVVKEGIKGTNIEKVIVNSLRDSFDVLTDIFYSIQVFGINNILNSSIVKKIISEEEKEKFSILQSKIRKLQLYATDRKIPLKASFHIDRDISDKFISWEDFMFEYYRDEKIESVNYEDNKITTIVHTGGTSGPVKRIGMTDYQPNSFVYKTTMMPLNVNFGDSFCQLIPPMVGWSLSGFHLSRYYNMLTNLIPSYDKGEFVDVLLRYRSNHYFTVPSFVKTIIDNPKLDGKDLSFIKTINHGGESITPSEDKRIDDTLKKHNCDIQNQFGFGQNELFGCFTINLDIKGSKEYGCCGVPLIGNEIIIVDPNSNEILNKGINEQGKYNIGEIWVYGDTVMKGYYGNDSTLNNNSFRIIEGKRFFNTGDQGYLDENNQLWFHGRNSRIIRTQSGKVFAPILEQIISKFDEVKECCVVGAPHPTNDKEPSCHIILKDEYYNLDEETFSKVVNKLISKIELALKELYTCYIPGTYDFTKREFPLTDFGKVAYRDLEEEDESEYEKNGKVKLAKIRYKL